MINIPDIEVKKTTCRKRIQDPRKFDKISFRTINLNKMTKAVIGCKKGKFKNNKCVVGTQIQSVIKKKRKDGTCPRF